MEFIPSLPTYADDFPTQTVWNAIRQALGDGEGIAYYKYPILSSMGGAKPDLTILTRRYQPVVIRCLNFQLADLRKLEDEEWHVSAGGEKQTIDSPLLELDDFKVGLQQRFNKERTLRRRLDPRSVLALPQVPRHAFIQKFGEVLENQKLDFTLWQTGDKIDEIFSPIEPPLTDVEWKLTKSVIQAAVPLGRNALGVVPKTANTLDSAMKILENEIALLDNEQHRAAIQIAPGPQRIRGLAGTGKTVLLAMKAANIHHHFPEKRVLFTFNTQSLYNQAKTLISRFYRVFNDVDPDWNKIHIRHAWGGKSRPGVYYDLCARQGVAPLDLKSARSEDSSEPFRACCRRSLAGAIKPAYDYVLVDEAQDFPAEFFRILYLLARAPEHAVCWAYDELQSLTNIEMPNTEDLFGKDAEGNALVSLDGEYPGPMDKDYVLHRSYRCPRKILMLAHGIGLGIHSSNGPVQMLEDAGSWRSIGYEIREGDVLEAGREIVITRPKENSPNRIEAIYKGDQELVVARVFEKRQEELEWIAGSISNDIKQEGVAAEQVVVISLDSRRAKEYMAALQLRLLDEDIASAIPGLVDSSAAFAEPGRVTLSTVHRAKGNEAPIIYILSFDSLYDYVDELTNRNRAFTSISRSKAWVRITGTGSQMKSARREINRILEDVPNFAFQFPDMDTIRRRLDTAEDSRRRREAKAVAELARGLANVDPEALKTLDPKIRKKIARLLEPEDEAE
jgi:superfamily I DNA and RNA helicase